MGPTGFAGLECLDIHYHGDWYAAECTCVQSYREWLGTLPHKLIRWSVPRLAENTEEPFTRIKQAIEQAGTAKACGDSFGYFDITSLRCASNLRYT
jgi:hypothetical protein